MLIEMKVEGLMFDQTSGAYVILLKEVNGTATLPIWIGEPEASSIALVLGRVAPPRPLTHDLLKNLLNAVDVALAKVVVSEIQDNTYYSNLHLMVAAKEILIDSRPSDAIATALRFNAPIYVEKEVLERRHKDELEEWLKNIKPEDFGNMA